MFISSATIEKTIPLANETYEIHTIEFLRFSHLDEDQPFSTTRLYILKNKNDLDKFLELYNQNTVLAEVLHEHYPNNKIIDMDFVLKEYDYYSYLWSQDTTYAIEAYSNFLHRERNRGAYNVMKNVFDNEDFKQLDPEDEVVKNLSIMFSGIDEFEDNETRIKNINSIEIGDDLNYYINGERCSKEGFIYRKEEINFD